MSNVSIYAVPGKKGEDKRGESSLGRAKGENEGWPVAQICQVMVSNNVEIKKRKVNLPWTGVDGPQGRLFL